MCPFQYHPATKFDKHCSWFNCLKVEMQRCNELRYRVAFYADQAGGEGKPAQNCNRKVSGCLKLALLLNVELNSGTWKGYSLLCGEHR